MFLDVLHGGIYVFLRAAVHLFSHSDYLIFFCTNRSFFSFMKIDYSIDFMSKELDGKLSAKQRLQPIKLLAFPTGPLFKTIYHCSFGQKYMSHDELLLHRKT